MAELQMLVSDLTLEQFTKAFGICVGVTIAIHFTIDFAFIYVPYFLFGRCKKCENMN